MRDLQQPKTSTDDIAPQAHAIRLKRRLVFLAWSLPVASLSWALSLGPLRGWLGFVLYVAAVAGFAGGVESVGFVRREGSGLWEFLVAVGIAVPLLWVSYDLPFTPFSTLEDKKLCWNESSVIYAYVCLVTSAMVGLAHVFLNLFQIQFPPLKQVRIVRVTSMVKVLSKQVLLASCGTVPFSLLGYWFFREPVKIFFQLFLKMWFITYDTTGYCNKEVISFGSILYLIFLQYCSLFTLLYIINLYVIIQTEKFVKGDNPYLQLSGIQNNYTIDPAFQMLSVALKQEVPANLQLFRYQSFSELLSISTHEPTIRKKIYSRFETWKLIVDECLKNVESLTLSMKQYMEIITQVPDFKTNFQYYTYTIKQTVNNQLGEYVDFYKTFMAYQTDSQLFTDFYPQVTSIQVLANLVFNAKREGGESIIILLQELHRILKTLLDCLIQTNKYLQITPRNPIPPLPQLPITLKNNLENSISRVVMDNYPKINPSLFSYEQATQLKKFMEFDY